MLTQLSTVKARLAIDPLDTTYDDLLTSAIRAVSARFDRECKRTLARTVGLTDEFDPRDTELPLSCYPVESVTKFETKSNETDGWVEQTGINYLIRGQCVVSLSIPINYQPSTINLPVARLTYTGGYVLPGTTPGAGQTALPDDLEQAAVEQVAYWFRNRDSTGLLRVWPHDGTYQAFLQSDLLLEVRAVSKKHQRLVL